jgi:hypothetical protein
MIVQQGAVPETRPSSLGSRGGTRTGRDWQSARASRRLAQQHPSRSAAVPRPRRLQQRRRLERDQEGSRSQNPRRTLPRQRVRTGRPCAVDPLWSRLSGVSAMVLAPAALQCRMNLLRNQRLVLDGSELTDQGGVGYAASGALLVETVGWWIRMRGKLFFDGAPLSDQRQR